MRQALHDRLAAMNDVCPTDAWGETSYFVNPGNVLKRGAYFATIKQKDGENDRASQLDRDGVWRLSMGLPRPVFEAAFGAPPARPRKGGVVVGPWDFTTRDTPTPHPVYGWMSWVCVLCPSGKSLDQLTDWIDAAHGKAKANAAAAKRIASARAVA